MRNLLYGLAVIAGALSNPITAQAQRNTLTQEEIAQGWVLLFDGKTTAGWDVQGDGKVNDGVLVLGGDKATRAVPTALLGRPFELRLEYRTDKGSWVPAQPGWNIPVEVGWEASGFLRRAFSSRTIERQSKDQNEWIEIIYTGEIDPATDRLLVTSRHRAVGEAAFVAREIMGTTATGDTHVVFDITSGAKLHLRNVKLKTESDGSLLTMLMVAVVLGILLAGLAVLLINRSRRRRFAARPDTGTTR